MNIVNSKVLKHAVLVEMLEYNRTKRPTQNSNVIDEADIFQIESKVSLNKVYTSSPNKEIEYTSHSIIPIAITQ